MCNVLRESSQVKGTKGSRMGQGKQMSNMAGADVVSRFKMIPQGTLAMNLTTEPSLR